MSKFNRYLEDEKEEELEHFECTLPVKELGKSTKLESISEEVKPAPKSVELNPETVRVVLMTTSEESEEKSPTIKEFEKRFKAKKIDFYTLFSNKAFLDKSEDGSIFVRNFDDEKGFQVSRDTTVFLTRRGVCMSKYALNLLSRIEKEKFFVFNSRESVETCEDKYLTILRLADAGIPIPKTALIPNEDMLDDALEKIGGKFPVVVKVLSGTQGKGVFIAEKYSGLKSTLQTIWHLSEDNEILIQEYIDNDFDVRIHILGDEFLAAMKRKRVEDDFRTNVHLGGQAVAFGPKESTKKLAIKCAKAVGALWAGVDLMFDKKGNPYCLEVNSSPGTDGIKIDKTANVPDSVIKFLMDKDNWHPSSTEIGARESIEVEGLGKMEARFDTGNLAKSISLDAQDVKFNEDTQEVTWTTNGKKLKTKAIGWVRMKSNSTAVSGIAPKRYLINLDIIFDGIKYRDIKFNLNDRSHKNSSILINAEFMKQAGLVINPSRDFIITVSPEDK
jgi:ribosomal protein S6--L-glutamate ligase